MEKCEYCGKEIPTTETPSVWQDQVACASCHRRLTKFASMAPTPAKADSPPAPRYLGLQVVGAIFRVGGICIALAAIAIAVTVPVSGIRVNLGGRLVLALGGSIYGVFICAIGEAALALRDIAISTWRLRG